MTPKRLIDVCSHISNASAGYHYGGGHSKPLAQLHATDFLDCSSSCSLALFRAGMFGGVSWPMVSGDFARWGKPGKGRKFTLWYHPGHVFIVFHGGRGYRRFDTSPWGFGGRGPRLRRTPRPTAGFKPRHWPGM